MTSGPENATVSLGNYPNTPINVGGNAVVMPDAAPVDTTRISVSTNTNFKGVLSANPSTGAVTVTNAHTAGTYTVTVTAFGTGGSVTKQFDLTVNNVPTCSSLTFSPAANFAVSGFPTGVVVGDFNNDGKQDVVTANLFGGNVSVLIGNGNGTFAAAVHYAVGSANNVAVGDLDLDGKQDLVVVGDEIGMLLGNGDGTFAPTIALTNNLK
jgi:hypothetical protein